MSFKFGKNREVSAAYATIPLYYTGITHPNNHHKELVLIDRIGGNYTACWRNNHLYKVGITFLLQATENGFMFRGKEYSVGNKVI